MNVWVQSKDSNRRNNEIGRFEDCLNLIYLNRVIDQASNNFHVFFVQLANTLAASLAKQRLFTVQNMYGIYSLHVAENFIFRFNDRQLKL